MHVKVPIEDSGPATLPLFFEILERHQTTNMIVEFLVSWRPDPDRDDLLERWIFENRSNFKRLSIKYFTHSRLLDEALFDDNIDIHYEVDISTMTLEKIVHPKSKRD